MFRTGKPRSKLGKWVDKHLGSQKKFMNICSVDKNTATSLCSPNGRKPNQSTRGRVILGLNRNGFRVREEDFWDM
jgi:putative transcriptional regulator